MKTANLIFGFLVTGILVSCSSSNKVASNSGDDIYYNPKAQQTTNNSTTTSVDNSTGGYSDYVGDNQNTPESDYYNGSNKSNSNNNTNAKSADGQTNYGTDPNYNSDDYYDYEYASRIRRFHAPVYSNYYYDDIYTNSYWYDPFPYNVGVSIYSGGFYGSNWGWNNGWNSWGFNNGWNRRNNWYGGYDPFGYNPYAWNSPFNNYYGGGYNNGYWNGYYDGLYGGNYWNNPYCNGGYFNSFDANNTGSIYGHRSSLSANNTGFRGVQKQNPRALASNGVSESRRANNGVNRIESTRNSATGISKTENNSVNPVRNSNSTGVREIENTKPVREINSGTLQPERGVNTTRSNDLQPSKELVKPQVVERPTQTKDDYFRPTRDDNATRDVPVYENKKQKVERENTRAIDRTTSPQNENKPEYKQNNNSRPAPSQNNSRPERNSNSGGSSPKNTGRSPR
jgi:hypothetical protein